MHFIGHKKAIFHLLKNWTGIIILTIYKNIKLNNQTHIFTFIHSVQFNCSVMSDSLQPHGLQHARLPCPSPTPKACQNSCPLNWWCHPTISSSVVPFSSHLQSFPASGSFPVSHFFASGGQNIGSFSFSISPSDEYSGLISFRIDWLDLLAVQGTLKSLLQHHNSNINSLMLSLYYGPNFTSIHDYWKSHSFD